MDAVAPSLGTQLRKVVAKLDDDVQALYDAMGVPFRPRFFPVVQHLIQQGGCTVTTLARAIGVSQPAATQTVAEMAKAGLVRVAIGTDARERLVSLSTQGRGIAEQLRPLWRAVAEAAADLNSEVPYSLEEVLGATLDALSREPFADRVRRKLHND